MELLVDGEEKPTSLFKLIKKHQKESKDIVSAYKDNVAFVKVESLHNSQKALTDFTKKKNLNRYFIKRNTQFPNNS
jgi:phosphoribosylformylglycinamidine synthase